MKRILVTLSSILLLSSYYYDKEDVLYGSDCDTSAVTYNASIAPVLASNCISCHGGAFPSAGIRLDNYTDVRTYALNGRLYGAIAHHAEFVAMPRGSTKLSACTIAKSRIWITGGAPNY